LHYLVDGFAVDLGDGGDVFGGFEAAFDFEGADAEFDEAGDFFDGGEVLGGEEVAFVAEVDEGTVDDHLIGHATGLGALATVGAASAEGFGGEALAGVGDAEGAVDEDFQGEFGMVVGLEAFEFAEGEFAGEDGLVDVEALGEFESLRGGDGHLGGRVEAEAGGDAFDKFGEAEVLDDDGVDAGVFEVAELGFGVGEFGGEDEGVEGDVTFDAVGVEEGHQAGEVFFGEVVGAEAGVEAGHAEVDGVGAVGDGGASAVPVTGGGEEFGEEGHWDCGLRIAGENWGILGMKLLGKGVWWRPFDGDF
jgi:hypothetical protein